VAEQVTLKLPDELARRVRKVANSTQRGLEEVLLEWLNHTSRQLSLEVPNEMTEAKLLQQINLGFSADWWKRYRSLIADRQAEIINPTDLAELIEMSEALEIANVKRVEALGEA
jgi:myo-inositol catabolism protein IolC